MSSEIMLSREAMGGAMQVADTLSKSGLIPRPLQQKPADVLVVLLTGQELGLGPMQALRSLHVIEGKAVASADLVAALCLRRPDVCEHLTVVESTPQQAVVSAKRKGSAAITIKITIEDAHRAGLVGKDNWKKWPAAMLRARAISHAARAAFPDLALGIYTEGEEDEIASGALATEQRAESRAAATPPHLREQAVEGQVVEQKPTKPAEVVEFQKPALASGEPSLVDRNALTLHEAADKTSLLAAGKAIATTQGLSDEDRRHLRAIYGTRQREVRQ